MGLKDKYAKVLQYAQTAGIDGLSVIDGGSVLTITGVATASVKDELQKTAKSVDPVGADIVLAIMPKAGGEEIYEIKAGDNLSNIAQKYPNMTWQKIVEANKDTIKDPDKIFPGQKIKIPV